LGREGGHRTVYHDHSCTDQPHNHDGAAVHAHRSHLQGSGDEEVHTHQQDPVGEVRRGHSDRESHSNRVVAASAGDSHRDEDYSPGGGHGGHGNSHLVQEDTPDGQEEANETGSDREDVRLEPVLGKADAF